MLNFIPRLLTGCAIAWVAFVLPRSVCAQTDPLVIVVHGIGGGNRAEGWSEDIASTWGVPVTEVTFRADDRTDASSLVDFASQAGDWALSVQKQIQTAVRANPGRRVIIVSHSWGTVVTKIALAGGSGGGQSTDLVRQSYHLDAIDLGGVPVDEWVTLGSPLGRADRPDVAGNLSQLNVDVPVDRPAIVKHWTNLYDADDPVSSDSHALPGADNVEVKGSGHWWDVSGMSAHTGIWKNKVVTRTLRTRNDEIAVMPRLPRPKNPVPPADAEEARCRHLAEVLMKVNEHECQRRMSDPAYGGCSYKIEYIEPPAAKQKNGGWYVVAAWRMMEKRPEKDRYFCTFQTGDEGAPQWFTPGDVQRLATQAGVPWN